MLVAPIMPAEVLKRQPEPYCQCWSQRTPVSWQQLDPCGCGEISSKCEWTWEEPAVSMTSWLVLSDDKRQVTFHPSFSSGTAVVKGDTPFQLDHHYYWEVKVLTETYGTDITVGVGTSNMDITSNRFKYASLLGNNKESYGLSYKGCLRHNDTEISDARGFCRGTIVGVRLDMWHGTLEYYINRKPQGIAFYNLRRHGTLFPMISSTAAQSSMRLVYAGAWRASLLAGALRALADSAAAPPLPPGLHYLAADHFWLSLPTRAHEDGETKDKSPREGRKSRYTLDRFPSQYINGFYVDNVSYNYRIVVRQESEY